MYFLKQVADHYIRKAAEGKISLADYTFVFPNKRSAMFMGKYLKQSFNRVGWMPRLQTITAFIQDFCQLPMAKDEELIFVLFNSYRQVLHDLKRDEQARNFDAFVFWGSVVLNDFNDVDSYMVDAEQLFKNLYEERRIQANYLTEGQKEVARHMGGTPDVSTDVDQFWRHIAHGEDKGALADKFVNFWEILGKLYKQFRMDLRRYGIAYSGMQSRHAAKVIKEMPAEAFTQSKYVFVGFNVLPKTRIEIFRRFRDCGADFFWDIASPLLSAAGNPAGDTVLALAREFPMPDDFELEAIETFPEITVYPVSSSVAQAKACAQVIEQWFDPAKSGLPTTGVVLPNERLLMPLLYSLPECYFPINVAMRIPHNSTPFASLMNNILVMNEHARLINGTYHFFYKDVLEILANPYIAGPIKDSVLELKQDIVKGHIFNVDSTEICQKYPDLAFIFKSVSDQNDINQVKEYLDNLIGQLSTMKTEKVLLQEYISAVDRLFEYVKKYNVPMHQTTTFNLIRRIMQAMVFQFNGNPVSGLQIMGVQDTRDLDFDDLAILSLNESILPPRNYKPSLIPPPLRQGYGLPTHEDQDQTTAYQFYRLLSRAKRVALFYDSRTPDLSSGEKSRFINQLELIMPGRIKYKETRLGYAESVSRPIIVEKTEMVLNELNRFLPGGDLRFSASAFKTYMLCPLKFYLQYVKRLRIDDFAPEYMDASSYGSILHLVAENFYKDLCKSHSGGFINEAIRKRLQDKNFDKEIGEKVIDAMCELYYPKKYKDDKSKIPGEGRVLARIIVKYIRQMLEIESRPGAAPFMFVAGEDHGGAATHQWKVNDNHTINFTMSIDRIDRLDAEGKHLRFIDYKTGSDELSATNVDGLFGDHKKGGIFQLMLYAMAYADVNNMPDLIIQPLIYKFADMGANGIPKLKINSVDLDDYKQNIEVDDPDAPVDAKKKSKKPKKSVSLLSLFRESFALLLDDIFSPEVPFCQTDNSDGCAFCPFINLCGRNKL